MVTEVKGPPEPPQTDIGVGLRGEPKLNVGMEPPEVALKVNAEAAFVACRCSMALGTSP